MGSRGGRGVGDGVRSRGVEGSEGVGRDKSSVVGAGMQDIFMAVGKEMTDRTEAVLLNFRKPKI